MSDDLVAVIAFFCGVAMLAVAIAAFQFLWNWLMPTIFGLQQITYWQAGGLMAMASLMFYSPRSATSKGGD